MSGVHATFPWGGAILLHVCLAVMRALNRKGDLGEPTTLLEGVVQHDKPPHTILVTPSPSVTPLASPHLDPHGPHCHCSHWYQIQSLLELKHSQSRKSMHSWGHLTNLHLRVLHLGGLNPSSTFWELEALAQKVSAGLAPLGSEGESSLGCLW